MCRCSSSTRMPPATAALASCKLRTSAAVGTPAVSGGTGRSCFRPASGSAAYAPVLPPGGATRRGYHSVLQQHRRQIDKPGAAQPGSFSAANHVEHEAAVIDRMAHRPRGAGHAAAYARASNAGPEATAQQRMPPLPPSAISPFVPIEKQPLPGAPPFQRRVAPR